MSKVLPGRAITQASRLFRQIGTDKRGNVMMILAFSLMVILFAVGFAIDYSRAMKLRTRMNAAADAAALAAVTVTMMQESDSAAEEAARAMFNSQVAGLEGVVYDATDPDNPTIKITSTKNLQRKVTVSYTAASTNIFSGILGVSTLPINGSATADATRAPHINFYLLMDISPSMLLPSSSDGLDAIRKATATTQLPNGCAFACHTQNPRSDNIYIRDSNGKDIWLDNSSGGYCSISTTDSTWVTCSNGTKYQKSNGQYADSYWLTRNYKSLFGGNNITLRIDEEEKAARDLIKYASEIAFNNQVTYKLQMFSFDWTRPDASHPINTITSEMTDVDDLDDDDVPDFYSLQDKWFMNNCPTSSYCNSDMGTEVFNALIKMNSLMDHPGPGLTKKSPQEVLFIITDGITDEKYKDGRRNREWSDHDLDKCTTIKNRGIRVAILYTEYLPESLKGDAWSQTEVAPYLPNVEPALKSCASTRTDGTPLYYKVTTDESISDALTALFALTVQTAHLTM